MIIRCIPEREKETFSLQNQEGKGEGRKEEERKRLCNFILRPCENTKFDHTSAKPLMKNIFVKYDVQMYVCKANVFHF